MDIDEKQIDRVKAIIRSMTNEERENPNIIKGSRRKRIANGSGTSIQEVNSLLKQFEQTKEMMRRMTSGGMRGGRMRMPFWYCVNSKLYVYSAVLKWINNDN